MKVDNRKFINGFFWRFMERCGAQGVTFVVSIVLARLLDPELYGITALVTVFTTILDVFVDSGLGNSLIQKKDADDLDFSSVFYFNIVLCIVLYSGMYFSAPLIAAFYERPTLVPLVRVISLTLIISGVKNIQHAYISRHMMFRRFFFATIGGTIGAAIVGIVMAMNGYGVWALVAQSLTNKCLGTIILWLTVKWRPKLMFSWKRLKSLLSFGWKLLVAKLIDTVYNDIRSLIIGKLYTPSDLAFYNKGKQFPHLVVSNVNTTIDSVLFPTLSNEQDNIERLKKLTQRAISVGTYLMMPLMMGIAVCAEPLVQILLKEKWLPCVPFLRVFCFTYAFRAVSTANLNAIKAVGRSDVFLKLEIMKKAVGVIALLSTMWISVHAMAYSMVVTSIISLAINAAPNRKLLGYSYWAQIKDIIPQMMLSCAMGIVVYSVTFLNLNSWYTLLIQVPLGVVIYIVGSRVFRMESYEYIINILKDLTKRRRG